MSAKDKGETPENYAKNQALKEVDDCTYAGSFTPTGHTSLFFDRTEYEETLKALPKEKHHRFFGGWSKEKSDER